jgi:predicted dehydrogenase
MSRKTIKRRDFVKGAAAVGAGLLVLPKDQILGANDRVNLAVIGRGGRGGGHIGWFNKVKNTKVVAVCDPDYGRMKDKEVAKNQDFRKILEIKDVDAVTIATPNHWHAPMAVFACQAGKHAYVEKPVSHCIWGGRKMVEAARKYKRIVASGTQHRSCPAPRECGKDIRAGKYGKVLWIHCQKLGRRASIGKVTEPQPVPENIDYNLWAGPAPKTPVMRKKFHYDWHWQYNWGDGEMGNWGIHYLDDVRNIMGWEGVPTSVVSAGGRFAWDDNGDTPNMHFALCEYEGVKMVIDIRNLPISKSNKGSATYLKSRGGNIIMCENAVISISRGGGKAYEKDFKTTIKQYKGNAGGGHAANFIDAVRSGKPEDLNAEIEVGHYSTNICHLANIAYKVGKKATVDEVKQSMKDHEDALNTVKAVVEQIQANEGDLKMMALGPKLTYDWKAEKFTGDGCAEANKLVRYDMRKEFAIPDEV